MPCLWNFCPWLSPLVPGRHHEAGLPAGAQLGVDDGRDDVHVGDPAVGRPGLGAVEDPLVVGLVVRRPRAHRADVGAGVGLGGAERRELEVTRAAEHLRDPLHRLLVGAVAADGGGRERRTDDGQADAGVAPEELLHRDRDAEPGLVEALGGPEVERVEPDLGGLLDDRPRELLALVPLGGRRAGSRPRRTRAARRGARAGPGPARRKGVTRTRLAGREAVRERGNVSRTRWPSSLPTSTAVAPDRTGVPAARAGGRAARRPAAAGRPASALP